MPRRSQTKTYSKPRKQGEWVTIRQDLKPNRVYGGMDFWFEQEAFLGKKARVTHFNPKTNHYRIDLDGGRFLWTSEMFEEKEGE